MNYSTLLQEMFREIPEFKEIYKEKSSETLINESMGVHTVIGILFMPYVSHLLLTNQKSSNSELLRRIFLFFERMAMCEDEGVKEVLLYTVLEALGDDDDVLNLALGFMKNSTKQMSDLVESFLGRH